MTAPSTAVVCAGLSFDWPDGSPALQDLDVAFERGRTGLVGANGTGKSTLLRLIAGELAPSSGSVTAHGEVAYLRQDLAPEAGRTVAELLGVAERLAALRAIGAGDASPEHFAVLDDDWQVEQRTLTTVRRLGLPDETAFLDRPVGTLSGGEATQVGLAAVLLRRAPITLLDEPTNNLDRPARERLYEVIRSWPGTLVVVSHDRELLELVDRVVELHDGTARRYGGPFSAYERQLAAEQDAARRVVRTAEADLARQRRELVEARVKLDRRARYARTAEANKTVPKIIAHGRRGSAQVAAGKHLELHQQRRATARDALARAQAVVRDDETIRVELPGTAVPAGRTVLELGELGIRGPERIALLGGNGAGKTTLLRSIVSQRRANVPVGYLPQDLGLGSGVLDPALSVLDNVRRAAPTASPNAVRAGLARFLARGNAVLQPAGTLSGGERFRVALACVLLADPAPQLLLLDEPTNNLDLASTARLVEALRAYQGALLVASHDVVFLAELGVTRRWRVSGRELTEVQE